jgi:WD40 repeat protein
MGEHIWSAGQDAQIHVWSKDGKLVKSLTGHDSYINSMAKVSCMQTRQCWTASTGDKTLRVWKQESTGDSDIAEEFAELQAATASYVCTFVLLLLPLPALIVYALLLRIAFLS